MPRRAERWGQRFGWMTAVAIAMIALVLALLAFANSGSTQAAASGRAGARRLRPVRPHRRRVRGRVSAHGRSGVGRAAGNPRRRRPAHLDAAGDLGDQDGRNDEDRDGDRQLGNGRVAHHRQGLRVDGGAAFKRERDPTVPEGDQACQHQQPELDQDALAVGRRPELARGDKLSEASDGAGEPRLPPRRSARPRKLGQHIGRDRDARARARPWATARSRAPSARARRSRSPRRRGGRRRRAPAAGAAAPGRRGPGSTVPTARRSTATAIRAAGSALPVGAAGRGVAALPNSARNCHAPSANRMNSSAPRYWINDPNRVPDEHGADPRGVVQRGEDPGPERGRRVHDEQVPLGDHGPDGEDPEGGPVEVPPPPEGGLTVGGRDLP